MKTHDFYYDLPEELIAQTPLEQRDASRLMTLDRVTGEVAHKHFYDIIDSLNPGDCLVMNDSRVLPARNARHARLFTWEGAINLKNAKYQLDDSPIDPQCDCPVCRRYSRAYIRHLFVAEEMLAMRLCVMHNLYFYNQLMQRIRDALDAGTFGDFRREYSEKLARRI